MIKISIIYLAQHSYWTTRLSFESIGFEIIERKKDFIVEGEPKEYMKVIGEIETELFVLNTANNNRLSEYFNDKCTNINSNKKLSLAPLLNNTLRVCTGEYIVIIPSGVFLQPNWLPEMIYHYSNVKKSGIIGIPNNFYHIELIPLLSSTKFEKFIDVLLPYDNIIQGLMFFSPKSLAYVGAFDENPELKGIELFQYCLRSIAVGLNNYYISTSACVDYNKPLMSIEQKEIINKSMFDMRGHRSFYLPL